MMKMNVINMINKLFILTSTRKIVILISFVIIIIIIDFNHADYSFMLFFSFQLFSCQTVKIL